MLKDGAPGEMPLPGESGLDAFTFNIFYIQHHCLDSGVWVNAYVWASWPSLRVWFPFLGCFIRSESECSTQGCISPQMKQNSMLLYMPLDERLIGMEEKMMMMISGDEDPFFCFNSVSRRPERASPGCRAAFRREWENVRLPRMYQKALTRLTTLYHSLFVVMRHKFCLFLTIIHSRPTSDKPRSENWGWQIFLRETKRDQERPKGVGCGFGVSEER